MPMRALVFLLLAIAEHFPHFIAAMSPCRRRRRAAPPLWNDLPPFPGSYRQPPRIAPPGFYLDPPPSGSRRMRRAGVIGAKNIRKCLVAIETQR